ncbi:hypothetical protein [Kribbella deserti]|uniref:Apea-like HEPN domain-containing protein n=1 Tax=Kribbella deserti TaxID=1926257 RepID=A0ABV6QV16_9ACTN
MTEEKWSRVVDLVGQRCLTYLLAADEHQGKTSLTFEELLPQQLAVLDALDSILPIGNEFDHEILKMSAVATRLGCPAMANGSSWAVTLRAMAGAYFATVTSADSLALHLLRLLRDCYALLLLPGGHPMMGAQLAASIFTNPSNREFEAAVLQDDDLNRLFPDVSEHSGHSGPYMSPGTGGTIQLWGLSEKLINAAWCLARLDTEYPSEEATAERLVGVLRDFRKIALGKTVKVPVRVGLTGVQLPDTSIVVDFTDSLLRSVDERDGWLTSHLGIGGKLSGETPEGDSIQIDYAGDVVLETTMDFKIHRQSFKDEWPMDLRAMQMKLDEKVELLRLALALATAESPLLVVVSWQATFHPFETSPKMSWREAHRNSKLVPRRLSVDQVDGWRTHGHKVLSLPMKKVEIAVRRALLALGERNMSEDILIDSVMVWENLFGSKLETGLRVCGSMAWLLGTDVASRKALRRELSDLYELRSQVVHGSSGLKPEEHAQAIRAMQLALQALRAVAMDHPSLLQLSDGGSRSSHILLGGIANEEDA